VRDLARRAERDRTELFRAAAQAMRVHEAIIEKDFWVCWVLDYLFQDSPWKSTMAFKGGTSLSKAFGAIERFSEDVDLILDWRMLGFSQDEPWEERSATQQDAFGKHANLKTEEFLASEFAPVLRRDLAERAGAAMEVDAEKQEVLITYPRAFSLGAIRPQIRLEIGPLADWVPNEARSIRPYAAERFPGVFKKPDTSVRTIAAERTFWEKITILHQEAHRGPESPVPAHYSRHYYDTYRLSLLPIRGAALGRLDLLRDVVEFKMKFYRCRWARYEAAKPDSLRLLPSAHHRDDLRRDYLDMQAMLFGMKPTFDAILRGLATLEESINTGRVG